jgi:tetratricopeptide (TPR) repeat protein
LIETSCKRRAGTFPDCLPFELSRRFARLPRRLRLVWQLGAAALATALVLGPLALLAQALGGALPFAVNWPTLVLGVFGLFGILASELGNAASARFSAWESRRLPALSGLFEDQILARALGHAIGMTLRAIETGLPEADAKVLNRLARKAERDWPMIAALPQPGLWSDPERAAHLADVVAHRATGALADDQAALLLQLLDPSDLGDPPIFSDPSSAGQVRGALSRRFDAALHRALKSDYDRNLEGEIPLALDLVIELLLSGAAAIARTTRNESAVKAAAESLRLGLPLAQEGGEARARMGAEADRLQAIYAAPQGDRHLLQPDRHVGPRVIALSALGLFAAGLLVWLYLDRPQSARPAAQEANDPQLGRVAAQLREAIEPRRLGDDPTSTRLSPEVQARARELVERGNLEQQAVGEMALGHHPEADRILQDGKGGSSRERLFQLLTLEGDNWYRAGDADRALKPYEKALALQPKDPDAHNRAALARGRATRGDIAAHRRRSIDLLAGTLGLVQQGSPQWALIQSNLGVAWRSMPAGDPQTNLERALAAFSAALEVYTREAYPLDWARTQNDLGLVYAGLPGPDRAANLRKAMAAYGAALEVRTRKEHPVEWAATQNDLGLALASLQGGAPGEHLREAIATHNAALEVLSPQAQPLEWAATQTDLGGAWERLPGTDRAEGLGKAIDAYRAALKVYGRKTYPADWAAAHYKLGTALASRAEQGGGCRDLKAAAAELRAAAQVWTDATFPYYREQHLIPRLESVAAGWSARGCGPREELDAVSAAR